MCPNLPAHASNKPPNFEIWFIIFATPPSVQSTIPLEKKIITPITLQASLGIHSNIPPIKPNRV